MRRCITTHDVETFGTIPAGSLWADDSPYLSDETAHYFADIDIPEPEPERPRPVRKSNLRKKAAT